MHVALLGDSTFDNAAYVSPDLDVAMQLRAYLGERWQLSLLAKDGSVLDEVAGQVRHMMALSHRVTHLVVSSGGNDLLGLLGGLQLPVTSVLEALDQLEVWQSDFRDKYRCMLDAVLAAQLPTFVCTVYDRVPGLSAGTRCALAIFNDIIIAEAMARTVPVIDLRAICTEPADYARSSPIEPSEAGGKKIAQALARVLLRHPENPSRGARIYF